MGSTVTLHVALTLPHVAVITASPTAMAFTLPSASTVATASSLEVQLRVLSVVLSGATVAERVSVSPILISADVLSMTTLSASIGDIVRVRRV